MPDDNNNNKVNSSATKTRIPQSDIPFYGLEKALKISQSIFDNYGGNNATPLQVASALKQLPNSSSFRMLCGSSIAYGLTDGGYNAKTINVLPLANRILMPTEENDDLNAKREAILKPRIFREFFQKYNRSPLPRNEIAQNVLVAMGVPKDRAKAVYEMILETAEYVKIIRILKEKKFIDLDGADLINAQSNISEIDFDVENEKYESTSIAPPEEVEEPKVTKTQAQGIFLAHGKNKKVLEQLKKILDQFKVPYRVAIEEPNLGRPISEKVKETMESCNCAILVFTADEEFFDQEGNSIWRPSENVIYELGASGLLYGNRIVILKEDSVQFPANFSGLGHISFSKDQLETKSLDVIKELIGFGILKVST